MTSPAPLPKAMIVTPAITSEISNFYLIASKLGVKCSFIISDIALYTIYPINADDIKATFFYIIIKKILQ